MIANPYWPQIHNTSQASQSKLWYSKISQITARLVTHYTKTIGMAAFCQGKSPLIFSNFILYTRNDSNKSCPTYFWTISYCTHTWNDSHISCPRRTYEQFCCLLRLSREWIRHICFAIHIVFHENNCAFVILSENTMNGKIFVFLVFDYSYESITDTYIAWLSLNWIL